MKKQRVVELGSLNHKPRIEGSYEIFCGNFMALYTHKGQVVFRCNNKAITLDEKTTIEVEGPDKSRLLKIIRDGKQIASYEYAITAERFEDDPTPMIDDEDFDFGLFVSNVSKDSERKEILSGRKDI